MNTPMPPQRQQVSAPLVPLAHNACAQLVALYGEMLADQEKRLQMLAAQLGQAQTQCAQLAETIKNRDAQIIVLGNQVKSLTAMLPSDDEPEPEDANDPKVEVSAVGFGG